MSADFQTIILSAGIGGLAGALFPGLKNALVFIFLEAQPAIGTAKDTEQLLDDTALHRAKLLELAVERSTQIYTICKEARGLIKKYDQKAELPDLGTCCDMLDTLESNEAFLRAISSEEFETAQASNYIRCSADLAKPSSSLIESLIARASTSGVYVLRTFPEMKNEVELRSQLTKAMGAFEGASEVFIAFLTLEKARNEHRRNESNRLVSSLKRKRNLALFLIFLCAAAVLGAFFMALCRLH